jgi:cell division transport system ATP-binding protein
MRIFAHINDDGATVLMATHNREIVDLMRRRVVALERGLVIRDDPYGRYNEDPPSAALLAD